MTRRRTRASAADRARAARRPVRRPPPPSRVVSSPVLTSSTPRPRRKRCCHATALLPRSPHPLRRVNLSPPLAATSSASPGRIWAGTWPPVARRHGLARRPSPSPLPPPLPRSCWPRPLPSPRLSARSAVWGRIRPTRRICAGAAHRDLSRSWHRPAAAPESRTPPLSFVPGFVGSARRQGGREEEEEVRRRLRLVAVRLG